MSCLVREIGSCSLSDGVSVAVVPAIHFTTDSMDAIAIASLARKAPITAMELSAQQARIVELILLDHGDKQIAREMGLRAPTVRTYLSRIFQRTGCTDRVGLVLKVFLVAGQLREKTECHQK
jgi:DNA-binding NarL/FixJ family response regulator